MFRQEQIQKARSLGLISIMLLLIAACNTGASNSSADEKSNKDAGSVGDRVWLDANRDGLQDELERGLKDVDVELQGKNSEYLEKTRTDNDGNYSFVGVPLGEYVVIFDPPSGFEFSPQKEGMMKLSTVMLIPTQVRRIHSSLRQTQATLRSMQECSNRHLQPPNPHPLL